MVFMGFMGSFIPVVAAVYILGTSIFRDATALSKNDFRVLVTSESDIILFP